MNHIYYPARLVTTIATRRPTPRGTGAPTTEAPPPEATTRPLRPPAAAGGTTTTRAAAAAAAAGVPRPRGRPRPRVRARGQGVPAVGRRWIGMMTGGDCMAPLPE